MGGYKTGSAADVEDLLVRPQTARVNEHVVENLRADAWERRRQAPAARRHQGIAPTGHLVPNVEARPDRPAQAAPRRRAESRDDASLRRCADHLR